MMINSALEEIDDVAAERMLAWADIKDSKKTGTVLKAQAIGIEPFMVRGKKEEVLKLNYNGIFGYLPKNLIDDYDFRGLQHFLGKTFSFVVDDFVIGELTEENFFIANRVKALTNLANNFWRKNPRVGQVYDAFVRIVDKYDIYLLVDGIPVTMHRNDYSYSYVDDLRDEIEIGEIIPVKLTKVIKPGETYHNGEEEVVCEKGLLEVSSKVLESDPWKEITKYQLRATYLGEITKVHMEHGLFIELVATPGLVVRTNFPPHSNGRLFKKGQQVNVKLLDIDKKERRITAIVIQPKKKLKAKRG